MEYVYNNTICLLKLHDRQLWKEGRFIDLTDVINIRTCSCITNNHINERVENIITQLSTFMLHHEMHKLAKGSKRLTAK